MVRHNNLDFCEWVIQDNSLMKWYIWLIQSMIQTDESHVYI